MPSCFWFSLFSVSQQPCLLHWQIQGGLFRSPFTSQYREAFKVTLQSEELFTKMSFLCGLQAGCWRWKNSPSSFTPVRLNLRDLYFSPSACQGLCTQWQSMLWQLSLWYQLYEWMAINLHLKKTIWGHERDGAVRGDRDLGFKAMLGGLVGAYNLQRGVVSVNMGSFKHVDLCNRAAVEPRLLSRYEWTRSRWWNFNEVIVLYWMLFGP